MDQNMAKKSITILALAFALVGVHLHQWETGSAVLNGGGAHLQKERSDASKTGGASGEDHSGSASSSQAMPSGPRSAEATSAVARISNDTSLKSACRIARDTDLCAHADIIEDNANLLLNAASTLNLDEASLQFAEKVMAEAEIMQFWSGQAKGICAETGPISKAEAMEYVYLAALKGDARSMVKFALGAPDLDGEDGPREVELVAAHARLAPRMLLDASLSGDEEALYQAFRAYSQGYISNVDRRIAFPVDDAIALASGRILVQLLPPARRVDIETSMSELRQRISAADLARSEHIYAQYRSRFDRPITREFTRYRVPTELGDPCAENESESDIPFRSAFRNETKDAH
jgi:uncharacterized lipoprotein NlpE involved in copper resistance